MLREQSQLNPLRPCYNERVLARVKDIQVPRISWDALNSGASQYGGFVGNAIKAAKAGACSLYRQSPGWVMGGVVPNPAGSFLKGAWNSLCSDDPGGLPAPPEPPFSGGQCKCVTYAVTTQLYNPDGSPALTPGVVFVLGAVGGLVSESRPFGITAWGVEATLQCVDGQPVSRGTVWFDQTFTSSGYTRKITSIVRQDGAADTCGDPSPRYPPNTYLPPPPSPPVTIPDNDGTDITLPIVYAPITPTLEINVNLGGVNISFDAGGVDFGFNFDPGTGQNNYLPPPSSNDLQDDLDGLGDDLDDIRRKIKDIQDDLNESPKAPPPPDDLDKEEKDPEDPKEENKPGLQYVCITLTQRPSKGTIQYGEGSPDWMAAGWFEWKLENDGYLPRQPIHFDHSCYTKPIGVPVVGYAYTLTNGARGYATVYSDPVS